jgi:DnaJ-class molecular chaperone
LRKKEEKGGGMTPSEIERQEFLLRARPGIHYGRLVCGRCQGHGVEPSDESNARAAPCKACLGLLVIKRRVTVIVEDTPVGVRR